MFPQHLAVSAHVLKRQPKGMQLEELTGLMPNAWE
jgi:hypothetical protein